MKSQQIIYLESEEDITSFIDKLISAEAEDIILVIPKSASIFQSIINLKLLKREIDNLKKNVSISTLDPLGQHLIENVGISLIDPAVLKDLPKPAVVSPVQKTAPAETSFHHRIIKSMADIVSVARSKEEETSAFSALETEEPVAPKEEESLLIPIEPKEEISPEQYWEELKESKIEETSVLPQNQEIEAKKKIILPKSIGKLFTIFFVGALLICGAAAYFILPRANLVITSKKEPLVFELDAVVDKNALKIDSMLNKIPGRVIKVQSQQSKKFSVSGQQQTQEKARGVISVYNEYNTSPQTLVETTRFTAAETNKVFRTTKTIIVPGAKIENNKLVASKIDVEVIADQPGPEYNIGPSNFTIPGFKDSPKYQGFYGKSKSAMSGGDNNQADVVSQGDLDRAKDELSESVNSQAVQSLKSQIPANLKLFNDAIKEEIIEISFSQQPGDKADSFTATIKSEAAAIVFDPKYIDEIVAKNTTAQISSSKEVLPKTQEIIYNKWRVDFDKGQINLNLQTKQLVVWKINIADLKKSLVNKDETEIKKLLSQMTEIQNANVSFWPFWAKRIPSQTSRITITLD